MGGPDLAATALARRPYDLRHAVLSLWLNATGAPAEIAVRAGTRIPPLCLPRHPCLDGRTKAVDDLGLVWRQQPDDDRFGLDYGVSTILPCTPR